jgi:predicted AAA+ superfamily ATPase
VSEKYLKRVIDKELEQALASSGAVLIEGAKWCGKTSTAEQKAASSIYMQDEDKKEEYFKILDTKPSLLMEGETPRLIDEWQDAKKLWNSVRFMVDHRQGMGQFILTGSATPVDDEGLHSGTGRFARLHMRTMSLFESLESNGNVSLKSLFDGEEAEGVSSLTIDDLAFALVRGGWPASIRMNKTAAMTPVRNYVDAIINKDASKVDKIERSPARVERLLKSLARNVSTPATLKTIADDVSGNGNEYINSEMTVDSYINALKRMFVVEDLQAWEPSLRSKTPLRTAAKRHLVDPSVAATILRASPKLLMQDFNTFGLLFESLCVRDLRVYAGANDGKVYHYRDKSGLEADAIIQLYDGRWGAVEVKMGAKEIDKAVENLIKLKERINTEKMGEPSFLMVLTAGEYAFRTIEGVQIVPIGCLKD